MPRSLRAIVRCEERGGVYPERRRPGGAVPRFSRRAESVIAARRGGPARRARDRLGLNVRLGRRGPDDQRRMRIEQMRMPAVRLVRTRWAATATALSVAAAACAGTTSAWPQCLHDAVLAREVSSTSISCPHFSQENWIDMMMAHNLGRGGAICRRLAPAISVRATVSAQPVCLAAAINHSRRTPTPRPAARFPRRNRSVKGQISSSKDEIERKSENEG